MTQETIDQIPEELLAEAKKELETLDWFVALKTNAQEDLAVVTLALELLEERRLQEIVRKTDHIPVFREAA
jgi:hypothetical protein